MPKNRLADLQRRMPSITDECGVRRFIALVFGFYARCENRNCRRKSQCVGEGAPCFDAFWWDLPEIRKDLYREAIKARVAGAKTREEIENIVFPKIMAHYTPEQIHEAAAQLENGNARPAGRGLCGRRPSG
jgi:hypothetical protein